MVVEEIAAHLIEHGLGTLGVVVNSVMTGSIFLGSWAVIPDGNGPFLTLTDTGGTGSSYTQNADGAATHNFTLQLLGRAKDPMQLKLLMRQAHAVLDGRTNLILSGIPYLSIYARQLPTDLGQDGKGRAMMSFNIMGEKAPS